MKDVINGTHVWMSMKKDSSKSKILTKSLKRANYKLVGVSLPPQVHEYLTLYALAKGTSKSKVLTEKIESFINLQRLKQSDDELLFELLQRIKTKWKVKKNTESMLFSDFKQLVKEELIEKGLNQKQIQNIITELEE